MSFINLLAMLFLSILGEWLFSLIVPNRPAKSHIISGAVIFVVLIFVAQLTSPESNKVSEKPTLAPTFSLAIGSLAPQIITLQPSNLDKATPTANVEAQNTPTPLNATQTTPPTLSHDLASDIYRGLDDNCFDLKYWSLLEGQEEFNKKNGCWDFPAWFGFFAINQEMLIAPPRGNNAGITTPISNKVKISFTFRNVVLQDSALWISLFHGDKSSVTTIGMVCGTFGSNSPLCEAEGISIDILDGNPHEVVFDYNRPLLDIYIDEVLVKSTSNQFFGDEPSLLISATAYEKTGQMQIFISNLTFETR